MSIALAAPKLLRAEGTCSFERMSYARWADDSDVYVFLSVGNPPFLECCGCVLVYRESGQDRHFTAQTTRAMLDHLDAHRAAGDDVPDYCYARLRADALENDADMAGIGPIPIPPDAVGLPWR